jgi:predicted small lipoprotein YifL
MKALIQSFTLVISLLFIASCGGKKGEDDSKTNTADSIATNQKVDIPDFNKYFEGSINNKYQITMSLTKTNNILSGNYAYSSTGTPIKVSGTIDDKGTITLNEYTDAGMLIGTFHGRYQETGIVGDWSKANSSSSMPFYLTEKEKAISDASASVVETEFSNEDGSGTKKICLFNSFKTISTGYNNERNGKMYWTYELYQNKNGNYVKVQNNVLFNLEQKQLLKLINDRIKRDFNVYSTEPDTRDCFIDFGKVPTYKMNDLGIDFTEDEIQFHIEFGLPEACDAVGGTVVTFKISDIIKYLN